MKYLQYAFLALFIGSLVVVALTGKPKHREPPSRCYKDGELIHRGYENPSYLGGNWYQVGQRKFQADLCKWRLF